MRKRTHGIGDMAEQWNAKGAYHDPLERPERPLRAAHDPGRLIASKAQRPTLDSRVTQEDPALNLDNMGYEA